MPSIPAGGPRLLISNQVSDQLMSADGVAINDLAVNPLSVVLVNIRPLNDTGTLGNFQRYLGLMDAINRVTIAHRGSSVFSMSGRDAAVLNYLRHGIVPREGNPAPTNNDRRSVTLPILLGRHAYDPDSCFPASRRGELTIELDLDIADTGYDGLRFSIDTIELLGADPSEFERKTSIARTFGATGQQDFDLPNGNLVRGMQLFGTTAYSGASPAPSWGSRIQVLLDNQQVGYTGVDFETALTLNALLGRQPPGLDAHIHLMEPVAGVVTDPPQREGTGGWENYCYLDFDPTRDDTYSLQTAGSTSFMLRSDVETADAVRVALVEQIRLK